MRRLQISGFIFCSLALLVGCNSKYVVPSYESKICTSTHDKKQNTTGANCAAALYNNALTLMKTGSHHASRELYVAAIGEYLKARTNLKKARIILAEAKLTNFQDWKIAVVLGLEKTSEKKLNSVIKELVIINGKIRYEEIYENHQETIKENYQRREG